MKSFILVIALFVFKTSVANTPQPLDAHLWLRQAALKTLLAVLNPANDRQSLKSEAYRSTPIGRIEIPRESFRSLLDPTSDLDESNILRLRMMRHELLEKSIADFKRLNKLAYYKIDTPNLLEFEGHLTELIEKLHIARALTASLDKVEGMHARTVINLSAALDMLIDNSLMEIVMYLNRAEMQKISRSEILNMIRNFADVAKLSIPVSSYSNMPLSQLAHPLTLHISGAYKFGQSRIHKTMSCRAFFR